MPGPLHSMCGTCRPRWIRLVDNVFPSDPNNRNPKSQRLNSLTHYTCRYPEKLGRIANYLEKRLQRDLNRRRTGHVFVAAGIADNLVKCCQRLDGLVCPYLSMVTSLVECEDRELQILGSASFCAYSAIDKETPNNLTEYAPLLERFVRMCLDSSAVSNLVRCAGLRAIVGLVRKIGSDDLQLNIWQELHMNQIVGAVLFNLEAPPAVEIEEVRLEDDEDAAEAGAVTASERPFDLAKEALDELLIRATFHNYACVIGPVLAHLDANPSLWVPGSFALLVFRTLVTRAPKPGYAYTVVERLVGHLSSKTAASSTPVRQCVLQVVAGIVGFAAGDSVGPAVYNVFKELCGQLARSLACASPHQPAEEQYRRELVMTMCRYAEAAPDTHKLEIMKYLLTYEPSNSLFDNENHKEIDEELSLALLGTVAMVADAYRSHSLSVALPMDLLGALLLQRNRREQSVRQRRQRAAVLAALLDRRRCRRRLCPRPLPLFSAWPKPADLVDENHRRIDDGDVGWEADPSASSFLLTRAGRQLMGYLVGQLTSASDPDTAELIATCSNLLAVQCAAAAATQPAMVELHRIWVTAQDRLISLTEPSRLEKCSQSDRVTALATAAAGHAALASYISLLCFATPGGEFREHVVQVIERREKTASHLLPDKSSASASDSKNKSHDASKKTSTLPIPDKLLFSADLAESALKSCDLDTANLRREFDYSLVQMELSQSPGVQKQRAATFELSTDTSNASTIQNDVNDFLQPPKAASVQRNDSIWSLNFAASAATQSERRQFSPANLDLSFNAFRGIMFESAQERNRRRAQEDQQLKELYASATFDELLQRQRRHRSIDIVALEGVDTIEANGFEATDSQAADEDDCCGDISEILQTIRACDACEGGAGDSGGSVVAAPPRKTATIKEIEFPPLFAY